MNDMNNMNNMNEVNENNIGNNVIIDNNNETSQIPTSPTVGRRVNNSNYYNDNDNENDNALNNIIIKKHKKKTSIITIIIRVILLVIIGILLYLFFTKDGINIIYRNFIFKKIEVSTLTPNKYYKEYDYDYVQITDDFVAKDKQHLLNIYYTVANSGASKFTFACSKEYKNCLKDVEDISNNEVILSNIKAFIHPFNGFTRIETNFSSYGEVIIRMEKTYTDEEIAALEVKVNDIISKQKINSNDIRSIIKTYHDYIINNTRYDSARTQNQTINYKSESAYGALIQGYALCEGYTDAMALFLHHYNIPNYKVVGKAHIWNAVYLDNKWYHLDLTWDDPITTSGRDILRDTYFLITTKQLLDLENVEHNFDGNFFQEVMK